MEGPPTSKKAQKWARSLTEAIVLQTIEDIWLPDRNEESMAFFIGDSFTDCAEILGLTHYERRKILELVRIARMSSVAMAGLLTANDASRGIMRRYACLKN
jgi:hypothetical protein